MSSAAQNAVLSAREVSSCHRSPSAVFLLIAAVHFHRPPYFVQRPLHIALSNSRRPPFNHQPSTSNHPPSTIRHPPSAVHRPPPSTVYCDRRVSANRVTARRPRGRADTLFASHVPHPAYSRRIRHGRAAAVAKRCHTGRTCAMSATAASLHVTASLVAAETSVPYWYEVRD